MKKILGLSKEGPLLLVLALLAITALGIYLFPKKEVQQFAVTYVNNDFDEDVARAVDKFYNGEKADILTGVETNEKALSIIFAGMTDLDTMYSVIDIVNEYDINCTFFLQGAEVAEYPRIVSDIKAHNNEVGSFTLHGDKYMEKLMPYNMIDDFVYSSMLIGRADKQQPRYLLCNNSISTDDLLKAAAASGYEYVVEATNILNYQSFSSYDMAYNYINRLPGGAIIEIKMDGVLEEEEFSISENRRYIGRESGIKEGEKDALLDEQKRLLDVIEWVCKAANETNQKSVLLAELPQLDRSLMALNEDALAGSRVLSDNTPPVESTTASNNTAYVSGSVASNNTANTGGYTASNNTANTGGYTASNNTANTGGYTASNNTANTGGYIASNTEYKDKGAASNISDITMAYSNSHIAIDNLLFTGHTELAESIALKNKQPTEALALSNGQAGLDTFTGNTSLDNGPEFINFLSGEPNNKQEDIYGSPKIVKGNVRAMAERLHKENSGQLAASVKLGIKDGSAFNYIFYGIDNQDALNSTLQGLSDSHITGMFFVTEEDILNYPESVKRIAGEGHQIGIALLPKNSGTALDAEVSLLTTNELLANRLNINTTLVMVPFGAVTNEMRESISAVNMSLIEFDTAMVKSADKDETSADNIFMSFFNNVNSFFKYGNTFYFRLNFYESSNTLVSELVKKTAVFEERLVYFNEQQNKNDGRLEEVISFVHTTESAVSYVFYGIENEMALNEALYRLEATNSHGTFFVTSKDINNYPQRISDILSKGNEIGIGLVAKANWDAMSAGTDLLATGKLLSEQYGIEPTVVMLPSGQADDAVKEAVAVLNLKLIQPTISVVRSADEFKTSADEVLSANFGDSLTPFKRGHIIYFRLDYYKNSDVLAGELMWKIKERFIDPIQYPHDNFGDSAYKITGIGNMLSEDKDEFLYKYPLPKGVVPEEVAAAIHLGHLDDKDDKEVFDFIKEHYIGNPDISKGNMLPGYTEEQISQLDTVGKINTDGQNVVFLTFDDWGNDIQINQLLYVLKKHNVKASFFIRTKYVPSNPNLLRAIAADGHDIGSHTVNHMELTHFDADEYVYSSIDDSEVELLQSELVGSYKTLSEIAGDVKNEKGSPTVRRYFRAPTLAQSFNGAKAVFDSGYIYSISGDFSTGDYQVESAEELKDILDNGIALPNKADNRVIGDGSIIVMHMTPDAQFTPEALDMFLTENEKKPEGYRLHFARLSDFLED